MLQQRNKTRKKEETRNKVTTRQDKNESRKKKKRQRIPVKVYAQDSDWSRKSCIESWSLLLSLAHNCPVQNNCWPATLCWQYLPSRQLSVARWVAGCGRTLLEVPRVDHQVQRYHINPVRPKCRFPQALTAMN